MNKCTRRLLFQQSSQVQGFTLIELLVGMVITSIIAALALQALVKTQSSFNTDQKRVENSQKMSSVLEIIGRDTRQAGEIIVEPNFSILKVNPLASGGSSIIVYRAISEPVSICKDYPKGVAITEFFFATDKKTSATSSSTNNDGKLFCTVEPSTITGSNTFPIQQQEGWINKRTVANNQKSFGMLYNTLARTTQPFVYTSESRPTNFTGGSLNLKIGINSLIPAEDIKVGDTAYLVEKKEYVVCGTDLKIRTNSVIESTNNAINPACAAPTSYDPTASLETVATNIEKIDITMITRLLPTASDPNPLSEAQAINNAFPITTTGSERGWQNIQSVKISIKSIDPLNRVLTGLPVDAKNKILESLTSEGSFYPRNVLSSK